MHANDSDLPVPLLRAQERIEQWRETREVRRIPEEIWSDAVRLAEKYGIHRTSRALRLNYYSLKDRVEAGEPVTDPPAPVFVDLVPTPSEEEPGEGTAEWADASGVRMRLHWTQGRLPDLAAITAAFLGKSS